MNRRFPWFAFSGVLLVCGSIHPTIAGSYNKLSLSNCAIASTGSNNEWKVSFTIQPTFGGSGDFIGNNSVNNFFISVPTTANGTINRNDTFVTPPPVSGFNLAAGLAITSNSSSSSAITIGSSNVSAPAIITSGGNVTFIISPTVANSAYPAALIRTRTRTDNNSFSEDGYYWFIPTLTTSACLRSGSTPPLSFLR